jgi:hypothetical protein
MLAFDLETTGLDPVRDTITCAAVYDPEKGIEEIFFFVCEDEREAFMCLLDDADRLCAFNGAGFDIPFIVAKFSPPSERVKKWRVKLHDVFLACKWGLGVTFSLQQLLEHNGVPGKTGTGENAIVLAREGRTRELGQYCMNDTRATYRVSALASIVIPRCKSFRMRQHGLFSDN